MEYLFKVQEKIVPELITVAENRYTILRSIYYNQPIGRRSLSEKTAMSERTIRNEVKFLKKSGMISLSRAGAEITKTGTSFLSELDKYIKEIKGVQLLEEKVKNVLGLKEVFIVPGNLEQLNIKQEIGRFTAQLVIEMLNDGDVLAVTGGTTLAQVANYMNPTDRPVDVLVLPGRGGLGQEVEIQANTIAATIAKKLGGSYKLLHIPDSIKEENVDRIIAEPSIQRILKQLPRANLMIHGVATAREMANRRGMSPEYIEKLLIDDGALGEALGYYFNEKGEIVYTTTSVGLHLEDLQSINKVIMVAGEAAKARAIAAVASPLYHDLLVTDELTAREILKIKRG